MSNKSINLEKKEIIVENNEKILKKLKEINLSDKWIYEKATKAFVSFVRFYQEHDLKYIFDFKKLDIGNLANMFQLMRLPRLKEILGRKIENFEQDNSVNPKDLVYQSENIAKQMEVKEEKIKKMNEERAIKREQAKQKQLEGKKNRTKKEKKVAKIKVYFF